MADIFISYAQADRERIQPIAEALTDAGYTVFWDPAIGPGDRFRSVVDAELDACKCVIVAWTVASVQSDWVIDEAEEGRRRGILVPILLDKVEPPRGFRQIHFLDLTSFRGRNGQKALQALQQAVDQMLGPSEDTAVSEEAVPERPGKPAVPGIAGTSVGWLRIRLWLRSLALAVPLGAAVMLTLFFSHGESSPLRNWLAQNQLNTSFPVLAGIMGILAVALGFWMRYAVFVQDRLLGLSSLRVLSRSFLMLILAGLLTAAPAEPLWLLHRVLFSQVVTSAPFSPDGTHVVITTRGNTVQLWDIRRPPLTEAAMQPLPGHTNSVLGAAYDPDGERILTWSRDNTARLWNARNGKEHARLEGHTGSVSGARYVQNGSQILTWSTDETARLWDVSNGKPLKVLEGHRGTVEGARYGPDRTRILTWSSDGTARLWNPTADQPSSTVLAGHEASVGGARYSPDGSQILTWSLDNTARLWDAKTGRPLPVLRAHTDTVLGAIYGTNGDRILTWSADGTARLWDAETGNEHAVLEGHTGPVLGALYSPDGDRILTWSKDNTARLWAADSGRPLLAPLDDHIASVRGARYSPDGRHILTWSRDNTARLWDAETGRTENVLTGHQDWVLGAEYSPDGRRILTWSRDNTARLWEAGSGDQLAILGHVPQRAVSILQPLPLPFALIYADEPVPANERALAGKPGDDGTPRQIIKTVETSILAFLRGLLLTGALAFVALVVWHAFRRRIAVSLFSAAVLYVALSYLTHLPAEALLIWFLTAVAISPLLATAGLISALTLKYTLPAGFRPAAAEAQRLRS